MSPETVFITGTDTGVGKTLLTALLYVHLRSRGHGAMAIKPFCTGSRSDAVLLHALQDLPAVQAHLVRGRLPRTASHMPPASHAALSLDQVNPYYFPEPVAPLVAARKHRRPVSMDHVLQKIAEVQTRLNTEEKGQRAQNRGQRTEDRSQRTLLVEGAGGLLAPLGPGYSALDLITRLDCSCIVVSANRLGTLNHTLLTARALQSAGIEHLMIVLSDHSPTLPRSSLRTTIQAPHDLSTASNHSILRELLPDLPIHRLPYIGQGPFDPPAIRSAADKLKGVLTKTLS